jgi:hypothetical protein
MQSWAIQFDVAIQRAEYNRVTAFGAPLVAADRARAMPTRPLRGLGFDRFALDRGEQHLALGDRQAKILQPLRHLLECRDLLGRAGGTVIAGDLEQNPDAHDTPPKLTADGEFATIAGVESSRPVRYAGPGYFGSFERANATGLQSKDDGANWPMASIKRVAAAIATILVREGVDYAQSKAVFKAARERAGLRAVPEHRGGVDRLTVEEELRFLD